MCTNFEGGAARAGLALAVLLAVAMRATYAADSAPVKIRPIDPQFIAALGEPGAKSGRGAQAWGLWKVDPGPRGVELTHHDRLMKAGGIAPARWTFDGADWWLEENGLIMEKPVFPLPVGRYLVTGARGTSAVLTILPAGADGDRRWTLDGGATLHDVTHLGCRSARYRPSADAGACTPARARPSAFPVAPGAEMPPVEGCTKSDYSVLIVIGVAEDN